MLDRLRKYRAWLLMGFVLLLNTIFGLVVLLPAFQSYSQAETNLDAAQVAIAATESAAGDNAILLQARIDSLSETFNTQINGFVPESAVESILNTLFTCADESGVILENMQLQTDGTTNETVYTRTFHLDVVGDPARLMNFIVAFKEASVSGVQIQNPTMTDSHNGESAQLSLNVVLMISPLADGSVLTDVPVLELPVPVVFPTVALPTPTLSPDEIIAMTAVAEAQANPPDGATAIPADGVVVIPPANDPNAASPTLTPTFCGDAPATWFSVGDTVVVDFNNTTTLRILAEPRLGGEDVDILANVSDNAILQLIDGPVCGLWEGNNVWYWQVEYGGITGWAGEANYEHRWMCAISDPECS